MVFDRETISGDYDSHLVTPYTELAQIYDRIMMHVNYRRWARYIAAILRKESLWPDAAMLDIGCGTAKFLEALHQLKKSADGCDASERMLEIARNRLPKSNFFSCHMPELPGINSGHYQVMTCLYDTVNYLPDLTALEKTLQRVYELLASPGIFIFDVVSRSHCQQYFQAYTDSEVLSRQLAYFREGFFDEKSDIQYNKIRIHTPAGVFEEVHQQQIFSFEAITDLIENNSPFILANVYDEFSFDAIDRHSGRAHFVLRKP